MKKTISLILVLALCMVTEVANADFTFGTPIPVPNVNSSASDENPTISADGLSLYYCSLRPGGYGNYDLLVVTRATTHDDWGIPVNLGPTVNSSSHDYSPDVSADGLRLYFASDRPGGYGSHDLWVTSRATTKDDWGAPVNLGSTVNNSTGEGCPAISTDDLELYFWSDRPGGSGNTELWTATRATTEDEWSTPVNLGRTVNSSAGEECSDILADGLSLFFVSGRSGGSGNRDLWVTTRSTITNPWGPPMNLGPTVNSSANETGPILSADGATLYFSSGRPGGIGNGDLWQVSITLVVDFNGDGIVDSADMCIIVDHWGENYPLCDIAPAPFGDGIVDIKDLILLSEHLFEEIYPTELVAYWKLDETEGNVAYDSIEDNHGIVYGEPLWQPDNGIVDGTLQFDGNDDYIVTNPILNPADGPFSVFAWVKGSTPGQAVLSQMDGVDWLSTDPLEGNLMTELKDSGRSAKPLQSQTVVTDGNWHRIGFVWDGPNRTLYVDDIVVAQDTQDSLQGSDNGLYIGTGKVMEPGFFWSGLVDDVRIYNRAIIP
ncbi:MAG: LamG-like jellyroll fold domain-containing protein [Planctomycetota bacterium]|jgi:hypothetical protein